MIQISSHQVALLQRGQVQEVVMGMEVEMEVEMEVVEGMEAVMETVGVAA